MYSQLVSGSISLYNHLYKLAKAGIPTGIFQQVFQKLTEKKGRIAPYVKELLFIYEVLTDLKHKNPNRKLYKGHEEVIYKRNTNDIYLHSFLKS